METMPLNVVILGSIPEAILVIFFGLVLLGVKPKWSQVIIAGILQGLAAYFIRRYTGFGLNFILLYVTTILITWLIVRVPLTIAIVAATLGIITSSLIEGLIFSIITTTTDLTFSEILSRSWLRLAIMTPKQMIIAILSVLCIKYRFTLEEEITIVKRLKGNM